MVHLLFHYVSESIKKTNKNDRFNYLHQSKTINYPLMSAIRLISDEFFADYKKKSSFSALIRLYRKAKILGMPDLLKALFNNAAYQNHVTKIDNTDSLFFLSHKYYLAQGFTFKQRALAALYHYEQETKRFDMYYYQNVYCKNGLILWSKTADNIIFDIRLMPGNDALYEGGCSVVFHVSSVRVCVLSYSVIPLNIILPELAISTNTKKINKQSALFVTRKQLTSDHTYQKSFDKIFNRITPAHLCLGALAGIGLAQGYEYFIGISASVHPSLKPEFSKTFDAAYTQFWASLGGQIKSPYGYLVELPIHLTPLEQLTPNARKRAILRRKHINQVYEEASSVIQKHLLPLNLTPEK